MGQSDQRNMNMEIKFCIQEGFTFNSGILCKINKPTLEKVNFFYFLPRKYIYRQQWMIYYKHK